MTYNVDPTSANIYIGVRQIYCICNTLYQKLEKNALVNGKGETGYCFFSLCNFL